MSPRSHVVILFVAGLIAVFSDSGTAIAQDEPELRLERREGPRGERGPERRPNPEQDELRRELERLQKALKEEGFLRLQAEMELEDSRSRRDREPGERPRPEEGERRDREREVEVEVKVERINENRSEGDRGPGPVQVAEAQVEAARAALELSELRLEAAQRDFDRVMGDKARFPDADPFPLRLAIAEARAEAADARARLIEAEFRLYRARRSGDEVGEVIVTQTKPDFTVDDALETAEKVIDLLRGFRLDERPR